MHLECHFIAVNSLLVCLLKDSGIVNQDVDTITHLVQLFSHSPHIRKRCEVRLYGTKLCTWNCLLDIPHRRFDSLLTSPMQQHLGKSLLNKQSAKWNKA
jgi:hypothetical protein